MPRGDGTGPNGAGPMTGRAEGYCAGYAVPGYLKPPVRYGQGWRHGFGRGWGRGFGRGRFGYMQPIVVQPAPQPQTPEQELDALKKIQRHLEAEKVDLEQEMGGVKARIDELKTTVKT